MRLLLIVFSLINLAGFSQQNYTKIWGDNLLNSQGHDLVQYPDSIIMYLGLINNLEGNHDIVLFRMTPQGDTLTSFHFGDSSLVDHAGELVKTNEGKLIIVGERLESMTAHSWGVLTKLDTAGNVEWETHVYDSAKNISLHSAVITADNELVAVGFTTQDDFASNDLVVVKIAANGQLVWVKDYGGPGNDYAMGITLSPAGEYVVSGDYSDNGYDNYIMKLDTSGSIIWDLVIGDQYSNGNQCVTSDGNGNYILLGETTTPGGPQFDMYVASVTENGALNWVRYVGNLGTEAGYSMYRSPGGSYYFSGYSNSYDNGVGPISPVYGKFDSQLEIEGVQYFAQPNVSVGYHINPALDGGSFISGFTGGKFILVHADTLNFHSPFNTVYLSQEDPHPYTPGFIYPNPADEAVYFDEIEEVIVYDSKGSEVLRKANPGNVLTINSLANGTYIFVMQRAGHIKFEKIIIEHR